MKLTILGATGATGRLLVQQALASGHDVAALVRTPAKMPPGSRARVVEGAVQDAEAVAEAVRDAEAVISTVGVGGGTLTALASNLVPAMRQAGVRRLISLVGAGTIQPGDPPSLARWLIVSLMRLVVREVIEDAAQHARLLRTGGLDWTLIRPPRLTDGPPTGHIVHGLSVVPGAMNVISRADLAAFMLRVATEDLYVGEAPFVMAG